jgi:benzoyl-CoA reductase/2-hydroxyglutaryl-CoA dehydratase subunit BcrC/BadD/HgdB
MDGIQRVREHLRNRIPELQQSHNEGVKIVGYTPGGYMPEDMVTAVGAVPVPLLQGGSHEAVAHSGGYIHRFMDTFCRAQIGYWGLGEDPIYRMLDLLVLAVTDNNNRAIAELFSYFTDIEAFRFGVPHDKEKDAFQYYLDGLHRLQERLEKLTGNKMDEGKLRESLALSNRMWELLEKIGELRKSPNPPITGEEFVNLNHATFYGDKAVVVECLESIYKELKGKQGPRPVARILLSGSTLARGDPKVLNMAEKAGAAVVVEEFAEGMRHYWQRVNLDGGDILEAIADRYFRRRVTPAWFRPSRERIEFNKTLAKEYSVDGVIHYSLMYRDGYDIQYPYFEKVMQEDVGLKTLRLESDYDSTEIGPMRTRIEAFIETIGGR